MWIFSQLSIKAMVQRKRQHLHRNMRRTLLLLFFVSLAWFSVSAEEKCSNDAENEIEKGNAFFTGRYLYEALKKGPTENHVMSPHSVLTPLAQLGLYSKGESLKQIMKVLHLHEKSDIRCTFPKMIKSLKATENVVLKVASKIYSTDMYPLSKNFLDDTKQIFDSEAETLNFAEPQKSADKVNKWVADQTSDRIKDIAKPEMFNTDTRLIIANAIYFLGNWITQFKQKNTINRTFYTNSRKTVKIPTMYVQSNFRYGEDSELDCKVLEMFYKGRKFSFVVFLPNKIDGLVDLVDALQDYDKFYKAYDKASYEKVDVYLPKIKIESKYDLKDIMNKVGISDITNTKSNITGILEHYEPLYVSDAVQKAFIQVDEHGTEAAAANVFGMLRLTSFQPEEDIKNFNANHPFSFYILHNEVIIFTGIFQKP